MTTDADARVSPARVTGLSDYLDGAPSALALPGDRPRPTALGAEVDDLDVMLTEGVSRALVSVAEAADADLETVLLAGFRVVLSRTTDVEDVVIGVIGARGAPGILVVRAPVAVDSGLEADVRKTSRALDVAAGLARSTVDEIVRDLGVDPGLGKHPVFQVGFLCAPDDHARWPDTWPTPPDLVLSCWQDACGIHLRFQWAVELFDRWRIERLSRHLVRILGEGTRDPGRAVRSLPLLGDDEVAELDRWNATAHPHDPTAPLAARFWRQVEAAPDAVAVEQDGQAVTYAEFAQRAAVVAARLRFCGVGSDVPVVVSADRSVEMVVGVLAVLMAGGAYVPVDPTYPPERRWMMIEDSGAPVLLTQRALRSSVPDGYPGQVLLLDEQPAEHVPAAEDLLGHSGRDLGYVIYTSGSTGRPKGVAMPQSALDNLVAWQLRRPQFSPGARTLQFSSLSFDVSFQELLTTWASGGTLVLIDDAARRDPLRLLEHLITHRVQRIFLPFVALRGLAAAVAATGRVPTDLAEVYTAGEQLQVDEVVRSLFLALPGCVLENQYGPSESHVVTAHTLEPDPATWPVLPPIGAPIDNSQTHVLDRSGSRCPVGVPGELFLGGACLARGYLGRPDLTEKRFVPAPGWARGSDRLYRTGDIVRWLPSGQLEFLGRVDHQVKFRGYRIEPAEVSAALSSAPGVGQCVSAVREREGGARLTAWLVPAEGAEPDLAVVHRYARDQLPVYMVPSHYLVVPELPLTSSGKIDMASLPDAPFDRGVLSAPYRAPADRYEEELAGIWSALLGVPDVGVLDDFFELGGDSLLAAEMTQRVANQLGQEMPLGALAQSPTIAGLAALLRNDDGRWDSLVPLQRGEDGVTPLFMVHGGSGNITSFPKLARALPPPQPVYALQWDGLDGSTGRRTIEDMAAYYLEQIRTVQEHGPYLLAGQCIGGLVAREMTRLLLEAGEEVDLLVMYDSPHLGSEAYVRARPPTLRALLRQRATRRTFARDVALAVFRKLPTRDAVRRSSRAMRTAALHHRPAPLPRPVLTHYVGSGESEGRNIALSGHWTDGAMGWASAESPHFVIHRIEGDHNEILYDPAATALLSEALEGCHRRRRAAGGAVDA